MDKINYFWFRRDLRLNDNTGLRAALKKDYPVQPIFIFDTTILNALPKDDARVTFIWENLKKISKQLKEHGSSLRVEYGDPIEIWKKIIAEGNVHAIYLNRDYEPQAIERDKAVQFLMESNAIQFHDFKDHVFFEKNEVLKGDGTPYTVFTPYQNKWLEKYAKHNVAIPTNEEELLSNTAKSSYKVLGLKKIGFEKSTIKAPNYNLKEVENYDEFRDYPALDKTSHIGHHLRFGTISIRSLVYFSIRKNKTYLSEIIWRDFFSQILAHFPYVVDAPFKKKYETIAWRNDEEEFKKWCIGETGYPIVDAGMRELNATGFMHNRVRMITASFLVKHLLIDWRWGEAYFAEKLLDFDLSSNNGNWQWAAGTGCDAAPYFRVFNPKLQTEKFDHQLKYVKKWIPNYDPETYIKPIVEHKKARERAIAAYKKGLADFE